ncbi:putative spore germination protein GerPB [Paenibacillus solanacearum]|uniref:Spore germination protein GerPB n=2 Tax=Paenibacillus solanacearum TaxID=2048548 RepID=A0A916JUW9_9BACL|nr:putative spore germination protein GerPB [Paenibacillus solanacearum]
MCYRIAMMQWVIHQNIVIHQLKVGAVSNSSVLQIGTAGTVRSLTNLYNTGGFTGPAPTLAGAEAAAEATAAGQSPLAYVPLPAPTR